MVRMKGGMTVLQGTFDGGTVAAVCEGDINGEDIPVVHTWQGMAQPSPDLAAFALPSNPIDWVVCRMPSGAAFGAGLFDDAADVAGHPLLHFSLHGHWNEEEISLVKRYEVFPETDGLEVKYTGKPTARGQAAGQWSNERAGSEGSWTATISGVGEPLCMFVYGSLQRTQEREAVWPVAPLSVQKATMAIGQLMKMTGGFPAALPGSDVRVRGELWTFHGEDGDRVLDVVDGVEGACDGPDALFVRKLGVCQPEGMAGDGCIDAWVYFWADCDEKVMEVWEPEVIAPTGGFVSWI